MYSQQFKLCHCLVKSLLLRICLRHQLVIPFLSGAPPPKKNPVSAPVLFLLAVREKHEEPQEVIFLHGIWRHIKEFGIEGQIPRISSPVKLEKRC